MKQRELAKALGKSQSIVSRYARRGMPMDVQGAKHWMAGNVNPRISTPLDRYARLQREDAKPPALKRWTDADEAAGLVFLNLCIFAATRKIVDRAGPLLFHAALNIERAAHDF